MKPFYMLMYISGVNSVAKPHLLAAVHTAVKQRRKLNPCMLFNEEVWSSYGEFCLTNLLSMEAQRVPVCQVAISKLPRKKLAPMETDWTTALHVRRKLPPGKSPIMYNSKNNTPVIA